MTFNLGEMGSKDCSLYHLALDDVDDVEVTIKPALCHVNKLSSFLQTRTAEQLSDDQKIKWVRFDVLERCDVIENCQYSLILRSHFFDLLLVSWFHEEELCIEEIEQAAGIVSGDNKAHHEVQDAI